MDVLFGNSQIVNLPGESIAVDPKAIQRAHQHFVITRSHHILSQSVSNVSDNLWINNVVLDDPLGNDAERLRTKIASIANSSPKFIEALENLANDIYGFKPNFTKGNEIPYIDSTMNEGDLFKPTVSAWPMNSKLPACIKREISPVGGSRQLATARSFDRHCGYESMRDHDTLTVDTLIRLVERHIFMKIVLRSVHVHPLAVLGNAVELSEWVAIEKFLRSLGEEFKERTLHEGGYILELLGEMHQKWIYSMRCQGYEYDYGRAPGDDTTMCEKIYRNVVGHKPQNDQERYLVELQRDEAEAKQIMERERLLRRNSYGGERVVKAGRTANQHAKPHKVEKAEASHNGANANNGKRASKPVDDNPSDLGKAMAGSEDDIDCDPHFDDYIVDYEEDGTPIFFSDIIGQDEGEYVSEEELEEMRKFSEMLAKAVKPYTANRDGSSKDGGSESKAESDSEPDSESDFHSESSNDGEGGKGTGSEDWQRHESRKNGEVRPQERKSIFGNPAGSALTGLTPREEGMAREFASLRNWLKINKKEPLAILCDASIMRQMMERLSIVSFHAPHDALNAIQENSTLFPKSKLGILGGHFCCDGTPAAIHRERMVLGWLVRSVDDALLKRHGAFAFSAMGMRAEEEAYMRSLFAPQFGIDPANVIDGEVDRNGKGSGAGAEGDDDDWEWVDMPTFEDDLDLTGVVDIFKAIREAKPKFKIVKRKVKKKKAVDLQSRNWKGIPRKCEIDEEDTTRKGALCRRARSPRPPIAEFTWKNGLDSSGKNFVALKTDDLHYGPYNPDSMEYYFGLMSQADSELRWKTKDDPHYFAGCFNYRVGVVDNKNGDTEVFNPFNKNVKCHEYAPGFLTEQAAATLKRSGWHIDGMAADDRGHRPIFEGGGKWVGSNSASLPATESMSNYLEVGKDVFGQWDGFCVYVPMSQNFRMRESHSKQQRVRYETSLHDCGEFKEGEDFGYRMEKYIEDLRNPEGKFDKFLARRDAHGTPRYRLNKVGRNEYHFTLNKDYVENNPNEFPALNFQEEDTRKAVPVNIVTPALTNGMGVEALVEEHDFEMFPIEERSVIKATDTMALTGCQLAAALGWSIVSKNIDRTRLLRNSMVIEPTLGKSLVDLEYEEETKRARNELRLMGKTRKSTITKKEVDRDGKGSVIETIKKKSTNTRGKRAKLDEIVSKGLKDSPLGAYLSDGYTGADAEAEADAGKAACASLNANGGQGGNIDACEGAKSSRDANREERPNEKAAPRENGNSDRAADKGLYWKDPLGRESPNLKDDGDGARHELVPLSREYAIIIKMIRAKERCGYDLLETRLRIARNALKDMSSDERATVFEMMEKVFTRPRKFDAYDLENILVQYHEFDYIDVVPDAQLDLHDRKGCRETFKKALLDYANEWRSLPPMEEMSRKELKKFVQLPHKCAQILTTLVFEFGLDEGMERRDFLKLMGDPDLFGKNNEFRGPVAESMRMMHLKSPDIERLGAFKDDVLEGKNLTPRMVAALGEWSDDMDYMNYPCELNVRCFKYPLGVGLPYMHGEMDKFFKPEHDTIGYDHYITGCWTGDTNPVNVYMGLDTMMGDRPETTFDMPLKDRVDAMCESLGIQNVVGERGLSKADLLSFIHLGEHIRNGGTGVLRISQEMSPFDIHYYVAAKLSDEAHVLKLPHGETAFLLVKYGPKGEGAPTKEEMRITGGMDISGRTGGHDEDAKWAHMDAEEMYKYLFDGQEEYERFLRRAEVQAIANFEELGRVHVHSHGVSADYDENVENIVCMPSILDLPYAIVDNNELVRHKARRDVLAREGRLNSQKYIF